MYEWPGGFRLQYFGPTEFDRPELMDRDFLRELDRLRERCGFPLTINDDARNTEDLERIYAKESLRARATQRPRVICTWTTR